MISLIFLMWFATAAKEAVGVGGIAISWARSHVCVDVHGQLHHLHRPSRSRVMVKGRGGRARGSNLPSPKPRPSPRIKQQAKRKLGHRPRNNR